MGAEDEKSRASPVPWRTVPAGLNPESRSDFGHSKGHMGLRLGLVSSVVEGQVMCCGGQWEDSVPVGKEVGEQVVREAVPGSLKDGYFKSASGDVMEGCAAGMW